MKGKGLSSLARLNVDGRIAVDLALAKSLPDLPKDYAPEVEEDGVEVERTDLSGGARFGGVPKLSILICIVGSRGELSLSVFRLIDIIVADLETVQIWFAFELRRRSALPRPLSRPRRSRTSSSTGDSWRVQDVYPRCFEGTG